MSVFRPRTARILTSILRELEQTVLPELTSDRARFVGQMTTYLLSSLIIRDGEGETILRDQIAQASDDLVAAGRLLGDPDLIREGTNLATVHQSKDVAALASLEDGAGEALESVMARLWAWPETDAAGTLMRRVLAQRVIRADRLEPKPRDEAGRSDDVPAARLDAYFGEGRFRGKAVRTVRIDRLQGGFSKDTFIATLDGADRPADEIVIRRDCLSGPIDRSAAAELPILQALHGTGFPVAEPLWAEVEPNLLGAPFIVVRRVPGSPVLHPDGVTLLLDPAGAAKGGERLAQVLARLHTVDLALFDPAATVLSTRQHVLGMFDEFEAYWKSHRQGPEPILAAAFHWLRANLPRTCPPAGLVHGDASLRNLLLQDGEVTALLDWETVHVGDPSEDLSYARRDVELVMRWDDFLAAYYAAGGPEYREENGRFWFLWARVRNAVYSLARGFETAPVPDLRFAYSSAFYHRMFLREIASLLSG